MTASVREETRHGAAVGQSWPRLDSREKITGALRYVADVPVPGLLHARLVLSLYAHARIDGIDKQPALDLPGVVAVLTADDLPIVGSGDMRMFQPLAQREVVFANQPIAIVVAETEAAAEDGAMAVMVDYTPLDAAIDVEASMEVGAPVARPHRHISSQDGEMASPHAAVGHGDDNVAVGEVEIGTIAAAEASASPHAAVGGANQPKLTEELSPNVIGRHWHKHGDVDAALSGSKATVTGRFTTEWVYQGYMEPHAATAWTDPTNGHLVINSNTQGIFYTRSQVAKIFGIPVTRVRAIGAQPGGAFGSKIMLTEPLAVAASLSLKRPVRLALTRREDITMTNPASGTVIELEIGADGEGRLTGIRSRLVFDSGAFSEWTVESIGAVLVAGPYRWQAYDIRAYGVETNRVGTGSYRGPGGPQASFALESLMDELAAKLDLDPLELRLRNAVTPGDRMIDGEAWVRIGTREVLEQIQDHPLWKGRNSLPDGEGVGIAVGVWPGGKEPAAALCRLEPDGSITIITGVVDMSGVASGFATIAAEAFGVSVDQVNIITSDTQSAPRSPMSGGSVVTYSSGRAVQRAVEATREKLLRYASEELEIDASDLEISNGNVQPKGSPGRGKSVAELAEKLDGFGGAFEPVEGHAGALPPSLAPSVSAHLAHVKVDRESGEIKVLNFVIAQDVGRALNPALVEGQMRGGVAQGIGWALLEGMPFDDQGQLLSGSFMDYAMPDSLDVPNIETLIVEVPAPDGPFGAKGIGEAPVCGSPAAVANAVANAAGARVYQLPITSARLWAATSNGNGARHS